MLPQSLPLTLALLAAAPAWAAAPCPANPLTALAGPWTFNLQLNSLLQEVSYGFAGTFHASLGPDRAGIPTGLLRLEVTARDNHSPARLQTGTGSYQINADCSGGTLTFNFASRPTQFDFWFFNGNQSINIVSTVDNRPLTGTAHLGLSGCPAGLASPQALLSGPYAFRLRGIYWSAGDPLSPSYVSAGRLVAANGQLRLTTSSVIGAASSPTRLEQDAGSYQVYPDCSGGTLTFNLSSRPIQLEFYFRAGFHHADLVSTTGPSVFGLLSRAPAAGCPVNPVSLLSGAWTYQVQTLWNLDPRHQYAAAGQFRASLGLLTLNTSAVQIAPLPRLETGAGRYSIFDDCTGGSLTFNLGSYPQQYDFWFHDGGLYLVSTRAGAPITGSATPGPSGCPAGVAPHELLAGAWSFRVQNVDADAYSGGPWMSQAGVMAGHPLGRLAITATTQLVAFGGTGVARLETGPGSYTVRDDCSGGTLTFNLGSAPVQYEFYFRAGFQEFDAIASQARTPYTHALFSR